MDPLKEIMELKAQNTELNKALALPERVPGEWHDISQRIVANYNQIMALIAHLPPQGKIKVPLIGLEFERSLVGTIEACAAVVAVPVSLYYAGHKFRRSWIQWRHYRVPFPDDTLARYCQIYNLRWKTMKRRTDLRWQSDAVKGGLGAAFAFATIALTRMRAQPPNRGTGATTCDADPFGFRHIPK